jgi:LuxR family maltose regulon positive regulatory protein
MTPMIASAPGDRLLTAKLRVPRADPLVPRRRLVERVEAGLRRPLTVISAPAGSGKTTLLSAWARETGRAVAWLSLDAGDNDPVRFLSYLTAALGHAEPGLGTTTRRLLEAEYPPGPTAAIAALAEEIEDTAGEDIVLILDDYHTIDEPDVHAAVAFLIDNLPPRLHLVVAGRSDPPLPLARLRARNHLTELRADDLRFTPEEAALLLADLAGGTLAAADAAALTERTEGWAAGLVLAGLSLQGRTGHADLVASLSGSHRYVLDYLVSEVLACQDPAVERFLLHTSILDRLNAPLAAALTGDDAAAMLERIERANLFLNPLDDERRWYRYHQLFAEALRHHLQQRAPALVPDLHRRAADWFETHGYDADALHHALAIPDAARAGDIVERHATPMLTRGEVRTLRDWVESLPEADVRARPLLGIRHAWALAHANELEAVEPRLRGVEEWLAAHPATPVAGVICLEGEIAAIRSRVATIRGDMARAIELSRLALSLIPPDDHATRASIGLNLGSAYGATGDLAAAAAAYAEVVSYGPAAGPLSAALALRYQAELQVIQGHLREADHLYRDALAFIAGQNAHEMPAKGIVCEGQAVLAYFWNNLDDAELLARDAIARGERGGEVVKITVPALSTLARVLQARGDRRGALEAIERAVCLSGWPHMRAWQARIWLRQGDLAAAVRWARESGLDPADELAYAGEIEYATLARVLLAEGRIDEASRLSERLVAAAGESGRFGRMIDFLTVKALALHASGDLDGAVVVLTQALRLAGDEGHVRVFVDEGPAIAPLLTRVRGQARRTADADGRRLGTYADDLLAVLASEAEESADTGNGTTFLVEPLSERESEVLRLLAAGRTNREIADELYVSLGTVKAHTHHLFAKLGVRGRTEAAARARDVGLLG